MHAYFLWTTKEEKNEKYAGSLFDDDASAFDIAAALRCNVLSRQLSNRATSRIHHVLEISYTPRLNNQ